MIEMRNAYKGLVGKPEWNRQFGRTRRRYEDKITMDVRETGCRVVDLFSCLKIENLPDSYEHGN
jgi:hypothetical protein